MSRIKDKRRTTGHLGSGFGDFMAKVFTKENIQTGVQVVQQVTDKTKTPGTISYNGTEANIAGEHSYLNYAIIGAIGLGAMYFMNKGKGK